MESQTTVYIYAVYTGETNNPGKPVRPIYCTHIKDLPLLKEMKDSGTPVMVRSAEHSNYGRISSVTEIFALSSAPYPTLGSIWCPPCEATFTLEVLSKVS